MIENKFSKIVFVSHWCTACVEEQFYTLYRNMKALLPDHVQTKFFCHWHLSDERKKLTDDLLYNFDAIKYGLDGEEATSTNTAFVRKEDTKKTVLYIVHFTPRELRKLFDCCSQAQFAAPFCWWQIEQIANKLYFADGLYCNTIKEAQQIWCIHRASMQFFGAKSVFVPMTSLQVPMYPNTKKVQNRLRNLHLSHVESLCLNNKCVQWPSVTPQTILLLGTGKGKLRQDFLRQCRQHNIHVHTCDFAKSANVHDTVVTERNNYLYGKYRTKFIKQYTCAVNVHQFESSDTEWAKIYLLSACGIKRIFSQTSASWHENLCLHNMENVTLFHNFNDFLKQWRLFVPCLTDQSSLSNPLTFSGNKDVLSKAVAKKSLQQKQKIANLNFKFCIERLFKQKA